MLKLNNVSSTKFLIENMMIEGGVAQYELYINKNEYHIIELHKCTLVINLY